MITKRFLVATALGLTFWFGGAGAARAQSYFYGYYYPDEHRFNSSMLNTSVYDYSTVTPVWNATHDSLYSSPSRLWTIPTNYQSLTMAAPAMAPRAVATNAAVPANIRVVLPSGTATVWFEGNQMRTGGTDRVYQSPPIASGSTYSYHVKAAWMDGGQQVVQERTVAVTPGQTTVVDLSQPATAQK